MLYTISNAEIYRIRMSYFGTNEACETHISDGNYLRGFIIE